MSERKESKSGEVKELWSKDQYDSSLAIAEKKNETKAGDDADGKEGSEGKKVTLLDKAVHFYNSGDFNTRIDSFIRKRAEVFRDAALQEQGGKDLGKIEHKLEYSVVHADFLALFEDMLTGFVESEGCSLQEFFAECQDAIDDRYCALFEEHKHHWFVDALLASMDYDYFFTLMLREARAQYDPSSPMYRERHDAKK